MVNNDCILFSRVFRQRSMQHHQDWSIQLLRNTAFTQVVPLLVVLLVPAAFLFTFTHLRQLNFDRILYSLLQIIAMVLDSLGISLPWLWAAPQRPSSSSSSSRSKSHRRKSSSAKVLKPRPEEVALQTVSKDSLHCVPFLFSFSSQLSYPFIANGLRDSDSDADAPRHYPGLVNISGTYCFMNSTLQVRLSSFSSTRYTDPTLPGNGFSLLPSTPYRLHSCQSRSTRRPHPSH